MFNKDNFETLFNSLYPRLIVYSINFVNDKVIAEEIVGDCFVKLWERRKELGHIGNIKSYLYTMVKNASFDHLERSKKMISFELEDYDAGVKIEQDLIEDEVHAILYEALGKLPEKCRKVFELSCLMGLKYKDIAYDLDISVNTVKSQRARAILLLQEQLKNNPFLMVMLFSL